MTDIDRMLITAGVTFVAAALGAIVAPFLKARFDRDLETRKATLARRTKLHEKELEIVAELYATTREITEQLDYCSRRLVFDSSIATALEKRVEDLTHHFHRQQLFLASYTRRAFENLFFEIGLAVIYLSRASRQSLDDDARTEAKAKLQASVISGIPTSLHEAERVLHPLVLPGS